MGIIQDIVEDLLRWGIGEGKPRPIRVPVRPDPRMVRYDTTSLAERRGWTTHGNVFTGYFRIKYGAWRGSIEQRGDVFEVFIYGAPTEMLQKHGHWACFHKFPNAGSDDYRIHLSRNPKDKKIDGIIFNIERILLESYANK